MLKLKLIIAFFKINNESACPLVFSTLVNDAYTHLGVALRNLSQTWLFFLPYSYPPSPSSVTRPVNHTF